MFDTFVTERSKRQRKGLRWTMSFSAFLHVAAGVALVGWSFWKVEKIMPRTLPITFYEEPRVPPPPPEAKPLPPVHEPSNTANPGPTHPRSPLIPSTRPTPIVDPPGGDLPLPGVPGGDPNSTVTVPLPPPEVLPPPPLPPKPPGLSDAERRALSLAYLHDTVQPHVLRHFAYPSDAQRNGVEGKVVIRLTIDAAGHLQRSSVVSCPDPILCQAALASAQEAEPFPRPPAALGAVTVDVLFEYHLD